jgi:hypothetical protein
MIGRCSGKKVFMEQKFQLSEEKSCLLLKEKRNMLKFL